MIGGFLGAGKTTAVGKLAQYLTNQGLGVGLITNDQGRNLVDTALLRSQGFATEEIPGGCFCCRFDSLVEAAKKLAQDNRPDVFVAEAVGSCTDLVATVTYPLRKLHADNFTVAPVSVLLDPIRALRAFELEPGDGFTEKVIYIYFKQIEEADLVIISKSDLLDERRLAALKLAIQAKFPGKEIMAVSPRNGTNLKEWFARLTGGEQPGGKAMDVDYAVYADGEALLGWLNSTVELAADRAFDADALLKDVAAEIQQRLRAQKAEVAHLKMTVNSDGQPREIGAINLVRNDFVPEASARLPAPVAKARLTVNLRAEAAPEILAQAVREGVQAATQRIPTLEATPDHLEHFRPGKPTPTHRLTEFRV